MPWYAKNVNILLFGLKCQQLTMGWSFKSTGIDTTIGKSEETWRGDSCVVSIPNHLDE
jgi:hypothetical protein